MDQRYQEHTHILVDAVLHSAGETSSDLRQAVESYAAGLSGRTVEKVEPVPTFMQPYITKVARYAYRITQQDIEVLRSEGLSEEAIFELTLSAALGAAVARLQAGLTAMKGETCASQDH